MRIRVSPLPARAALALLVAASVACATLRPMGTNERFIQGTWTHNTDLGDGHASYLDWTFAAGTFTVEGYPPLYHTGQYRVTSDDGAMLTLALSGQAGDWPTDDRALVIVLDTAADTLTIDDSGPFTRAVP